MGYNDKNMSSGWMNCYKQGDFVGAVLYCKNNPDSIPHPLLIFIVVCLF